jgi:hypothetical protein
MSLRLFVLSALLLLLSGCITGPKDPGQTPLEKLNGENYEPQDSTLLVPFAVRKPVHRVISGYVRCGDGISQRPENSAKIQVINDSNLIAEVSSNADGSYRLSVEVQPGAHYKLIAASTCGKYSQDFTTDAEAKKALTNHDLILK